MCSGPFYPNLHTSDQFAVTEMQNINLGQELQHMNRKNKGYKSCFHFRLLGITGKDAVHPCGC